MESLDKFFKDNQRGYPRDPRRMAYAKLQKNTQGMDREQLEAFITANLFIPHSQYKMALGNLIQFLKKQDQMSTLNEVKQFQKIAGLINENWHPDDPASVDMDDIEDEDPEDFDDVSEDADYESESGDTNAMGDTDAMSIDESKVEDVFQRYTPVLLKALTMRSKNPEDIDAHNAVKKILETIASTLGLDSSIPFMENEYFSGHYSPEEALKYAKEMFHDWERESGDTDAMNVSEAGNVKGIKIEIPGNSYASDFGKAAAREVVESFGPREYRSFLEAFLNEFKKITGGV
jgi:hypothetical protein